MPSSAVEDGWLTLLAAPPAAGFDGAVDGALLVLPTLLEVAIEMGFTGLFAARSEPGVVS